VVALSDDEKWPELSVATKNEQSVKVNPSPTSSKSTESKPTPPASDNPNPLTEAEQQANANRRGTKFNWKKVDIDINYTKPNEKKHSQPRKNVRSTGGENEPRQSSNKRRPQSRKSNVSSSDLETQSEHKNEKGEDSNRNEKAASHRQAQPTESLPAQSYPRRDTKSSADYNNRSHR
jgi:hypothetical protein